MEWGCILWHTWESGVFVISKVHRSTRCCELGELWAMLAQNIFETWGEKSCCFHVCSIKALFTVPCHIEVCVFFFAGSDMTIQTRSRRDMGFINVGCFDLRNWCHH